MKAATLCPTFWVSAFCLGVFASNPLSSSEVLRPEFTAISETASHLRAPNGMSKASGDGITDPSEYYAFQDNSDSSAQGFTLEPDSVVVRHRVNLNSHSEGEGPFLSWGRLNLGLRYEGGILSLLQYNHQKTEWEKTEFEIWDSSTGGWLNLELMRGIRDGKVIDLIMINGSLVGFQEYSDTKSFSEYSVFKLPFCEIKLSTGMQSADYPGHALRALRRLGIRYDNLGEYVNAGKLNSTKPPNLLLKMPSDEVRKLRGGSGRFKSEIHSGDLTMEEETWFMTRTVNRAYYEYLNGIDVRQLPYLEDTLTFLGSDYLPTLESRAWKAPWDYSNYGDNYIEKIYGYLMVEESGTYRIYLSADETAGLFISTSTIPENLQEFLVIDSPTLLNDWKVENSGYVYLEADQPVYFEAWHVERTGDDHFAMAWETPEGAIAPIPSFLISSYSGGVPGTFPRNFIIKDPSLLTEDLAIFDTASVDTVPMDLAGPYDQIDGGATIKLADFPTEGGARFHAFESFGAGLDWLWTDSANWPSVNAIGTGGLDWMWYEQETSNPQVFYDYTESSWLHYYHLPYPRVWYDGKVLPVKWDFNDIGPYDWDQVAAPDDDDDWAWDGQPTSSSGTGPSGDRDFQNGGLPGQYIYLETSSPNPAYTAGAEAMLVSPYLYIEPGESMLHFYYHMYGSNIGTLHVDIWSDGAWTNSIWSISGQQHTSTTSPYHRADISLENTFAGRLIKVRIRGVAAGGYRGDMAFDDVILYVNDSDADGDGMLDGLEFLTSSNPFDGTDEVFNDPDLDLISYEVEALAGYGLNGLDPGSYWPENSALNNAVTNEGCSAVIVTPEGTYGIDLSNLEIIALEF